MFTNLLMGNLVQRIALADCRFCCRDVRPITNQQLPSANVAAIRYREMLLTVSISAFITVEKLAAVATSGNDPRPKKTCLAK